MIDFTIPDRSFTMKHEALVTPKLLAKPTFANSQVLEQRSLRIISLRLIVNFRSSGIRGRFGLGRMEGKLEDSREVIDAVD
jgi:hypothetical protein